MSERAVYDTMIFFQWAALPENRQHQTIKALYEGSIRLCLSPAHLTEIKDVLTRPEIMQKAPNLTPQRVENVLFEALALADWFDDVPVRFSLPAHPDDDHIFNLAIAANVRYLVTWESRLLALATRESPEARQLRALAPRLEIIAPPQLAERLRTRHS
ncbi:MAG TPA: PIN domain-containing protein [Chthoniobacteraceae bacterium]|nr:PIN domain-containing protein [Chthoniobacteraceae bacterium]